MRRLRQIAETISERVTFEDERLRVYTEWSAKTITTFVIAAGFTDKDGKKKLFEELNSISLVKGKEKSEVQGPKENRAGSFERLQQIFTGQLQG